jgi:hypothetical protein
MTSATLTDLAGQSLAVALVLPRYQVSYWEPDGPSTAPSPLHATPATATDFQVERVLKGTLPGWIQGRQGGAVKGSEKVCDALSYEEQGNPVPRVGRKNVLFLQRDFGGGFFGPSGGFWRFEVRDGRVYSGGHQVPFSATPTDIDGMPLEQFVALIQAAPSSSTPP